MNATPQILPFQSLASPRGATLLDPADLSGAFAGVMADGDKNLAIALGSTVPEPKGTTPIIVAPAADGIFEGPSADEGLFDIPVKAPNEAEIEPLPLAAVQALGASDAPTASLPHAAEKGKAVAPHIWHATAAQHWHLAQPALADALPGQTEGLLTRETAEQPTETETAPPDAPEKDPSVSPTDLAPPPPPAPMAGVRVLPSVPPPNADPAPSAEVDLPVESAGACFAPVAAVSSESAAAAKSLPQMDATHAARSADQVTPSGHAQTRPASGPDRPDAAANLVSSAALFVGLKHGAHPAGSSGAEPVAKETRPVETKNVSPLNEVGQPGTTRDEARSSGTLGIAVVQSQSGKTTSCGFADQSPSILPQAEARLIRQDRQPLLPTSEAAKSPGTTVARSQPSPESTPPLPGGPSTSPEKGVQRPEGEIDTTPVPVSAIGTERDLPSLPESAPVSNAGALPVVRVLSDSGARRAVLGEGRAPSNASDRNPAPTRETVHAVPLTVAAIAPAEARGVVDQGVTKEITPIGPATSSEVERMRPILRDERTHVERASPTVAPSLTGKTEGHEAEAERLKLPIRSGIEQISVRVLTEPAPQPGVSVSQSSSRPPTLEAKGGEPPVILPIAAAGESEALPDKAKVAPLPVLPTRVALPAVSGAERAVVLARGVEKVEGAPLAKSGVTDQQSAVFTNDRLPQESGRAMTGAPRSAGIVATALEGSLAPRKPEPPPLREAAPPAQRAPAYLAMNSAKAAVVEARSDVPKVQARFPLREPEQPLPQASVRPAPRAVLVSEVTPEDTVTSKTRAEGSRAEAMLKPRETQLPPQATLPSAPRAAPVWAATPAEVAPVEDRSPAMQPAAAPAPHGSERPAVPASAHSAGRVATSSTKTPAAVTTKEIRSAPPEVVAHLAKGPAGLALPGSEATTPMSEVAQRPDGAWHLQGTAPQRERPQPTGRVRAPASSAMPQPVENPHVMAKPRAVPSQEPPLAPRRAQPEVAAEAGRERLSDPPSPIASAPAPDKAPQAGPPQVVGPPALPPLAPAISTAHARHSGPSTASLDGGGKTAHALPTGFSSGLAHAVADSGHSRAELILDPAELGRLRFDILTQGSQVQIHLSAERPETLDLLRRHSEELRQEFQAAGFDTGSLNFGQWSQKGQDRAAPTAPLGPDTVSDGFPLLDLPATPAPRTGPSGSGLDLRL